MASVLTKSDVAEILGIEDDDISSFVYLYAKEQFYALTGWYAAETQKWHKEFVKRDTVNVKLPDVDIKSIDTIKYDNEEQTDLSNFDGYTLNPVTGFVIISGGLVQGILLEIEYTINAYTHTELSNLLIALLTYKGIGLFTPDKMTQVKSIKIGNYSKSYAGTAKSQGDLLNNLEKEILKLRAMVVSGKDSSQLSFGYFG